MIKKCWDCGKEFKTETGDELFCDECEKKDNHPTSTGVLKIYDKI